MAPVERITDRIGAAVVRLRLPIIIGTALLTAVLGFFIKDLRINADFLSYLPPGDPVTELNRTIGERFGGSQTAVVILEGEDVFAPATLRRVQKLTEQLELVEGVQFVTSLTNVLDVKKVEDWLEIGPLVDAESLAGNDGGDRLQALRRYALGKPMYSGRLVSGDGSATIVVCQLFEDADEAAAAREIRRAVLAAGLPERTHFAGVAFQMVEIDHLVQLDFLRLVPLAALLIVLSLYLSFRSLRGVLLPLSAAAISSVWTLGAMSLAGVDFSVVTDIIAVVLLAVGSAYGIHVLARFNEESAAPDGRRRTATALSRVLVPVLLAAVTTIAGFLSFVFGSYLTLIREFGVFSALGVLFALLLSITFVPAVLSYLPPPRARVSAPGDRPAARPTRPARFLAAVRRGLLRRRFAVLAVGAVLTAAGLAGVPRLVREVDFLSYFPGKTEVRLSERIMRDKFGGSTPLQVLVEGEALDPAVLREMKALEEFLRRQPQIANAHSIVELFEEMNWVITDQRALPRTREEAGNLWFLLEGDPMLTPLVGEGAAVIQATVNTQNSRENSRLVQALQGYIDEHPSGVAAFRFAGIPAVYHRLDQALKQSLGRSLLLAVALVFLCNLALLRSAGGGLIGMVPIGFTLVVLFGTMGFAGIPLDIVTVLLGSISMGIGIDYSLHFLSRFRSQYRDCGDREQALERTLATTGMAIVVNMATVAAGFLTLTLGTFIPIARFGLLVAITMAGSGLGALTLLPAVIRVSPQRVFAGLVEGGAPRQRRPWRRRKARETSRPGPRVPWPPRLKPVPSERGTIRKENEQ